VLLGCRPDVAGADAALAPLVTADLVAAALADVPADWLTTELAAYADRLLARVAARESWVPPLVEAAAAGAGERTPTRGSRPRWLDGGGAR
jgi:hypothetical protein